MRRLSYQADRRLPAYCQRCRHMSRPPSLGRHLALCSPTWGGSDVPPMRGVSQAEGERYHVSRCLCASKWCLPAPYFSERIRTAQIRPALFCEDLVASLRSRVHGIDAHIRLAVKPVVRLQEQYDGIRRMASTAPELPRPSRVWGDMSESGSVRVGLLLRHLLPCSMPGPSFYFSRPVKLVSSGHRHLFDLVA